MQDDFNPQGPRGPRHNAATIYQSKLSISIHKALAGLDSPRVNPPDCTMYFNPQGPRGPRRLKLKDGKILGHFNPQGPRGPRRLQAISLLSVWRFQSTRPSRASTNRNGYSEILLQISIHKALAGLDLQYGALEFFHNYFNPQGPRGPRQKSETG